MIEYTKHRIYTGNLQQILETTSH